LIRSFRILAILLLAACGGGSVSLHFVGVPPAGAEVGKSFVYRLRVESASGTLHFTLLQGPAGMAVDATGKLSWQPQYADLGSHPVRVQVRDDKTTLVQAWTLRAHQGLLMGTALSPRRHTLSSSTQDFVNHYSGHGPWGRIIAFHMGWRENGTGVVPTTALAAMLAANQYGFVPAIGFGWADGNGNPDLASAGDPLDNSWANAETRADFLTMVTDFAAANQPPYLFLGNETNSYFVTHTQPEWDEWMSELADCYAAVKAASPATIVFTTLQYEKLLGLGALAGWAFPPQPQLITELLPGVHADALGLTSYPYLEYAAPSDIPAGYYDSAGGWGGPVVFTELGWLAAPSFPYGGSEADQAAFIDLFFDLTQALDLEYVSWLFLHDWDQQASLPAFANVGFRNNTASHVRPSDAVWQAAVALRERP